MGIGCVCVHLLQKGLGHTYTQVFVGTEPPNVTAKKKQSFYIRSHDKDYLYIKNNLARA